VKGHIEGNFKSLKKAQVAFQGELQKAGYKPQKVDGVPKSAAEANIEQYMNAKDLYWAESHRFKGKGGKGGRGGI
jgi:hypothetical protein